MKILITITILTILALFTVNADAGAYCTKGRSKPCGHGCIPEYKTCRTSWTTAQFGVNPNKGGKPAYGTPKFVKEAPKQ